VKTSDPHMWDLLTYTWFIIHEALKWEEMGFWQWLSVQGACSSRHTPISHTYSQYTQTHTHTSHSHLECTEDTDTAVTLRLSAALPGLIQVPQDLEEGRTENIPAMTVTGLR